MTTLPTNPVPTNARELIGGNAPSLDAMLRHIASHRIGDIASLCDLLIAQKLPTGGGTITLVGILFSLDLVGGTFQGFYPTEKGLHAAEVGIETFVELQKQKEQQSERRLQRIYIATLLGVAATLLGTIASIVSGWSAR